MHLLLSGEGAGDIGVCDPSLPTCDRMGLSEGPMAIIVDQLVELFQGYEMSHLEYEKVSFVSKTYLVENKASPKSKGMSLPGKKKPVETKYFYENARSLAIAAKVKCDEINDKVVAVLFRDSDGTASAGRGFWSDKRKSMIEGFKAEQFEFGVAMVPKPKSEAWLLCATEKGYQHCQLLENEPGNDGSNRLSLKSQLEKSLRGKSSKEDINALLRDLSIDVNLINMPSFNIFKEDLRDAVNLANTNI
ncbi:MAG: hypothetical protein ABJN96_01085 [Marinomonas sp.]